MTRQPVIEAVAVGKRYVKYDDEAMITSRTRRLWSRTRRSHHWALRGLDFEVHAGECVGLIGRNGSGKSTLLRMLAGVTAPTEGRVRVRGRVAPLIAVGVGFHPELTGRENVYVNASILGVPSRVVDARLDDIVGFAGIEEFIDTPVKFYSSGMFVRLGFAVSMYAEPDVLLVDEVLAVGDIAFQLQCFDRMREVGQKGTAIVVVSHNLNSIRRLCPTTLLLDHGNPLFFGETTTAISRYHDLLGEQREPEGDDDLPASDDTIATRARVVGVELRGPDGSPTRHVASTDEVVFELELAVTDELVDPLVALRIYNGAGVEVYGDSTFGAPTGTFAAGSRLRCDVRVVPRLASGDYSAAFSVATADGTRCVVPHRPLSFFVDGRPTAWGAADLEAKFAVTSPGD